jgi:F-type H+-transporting ATPase subunit alpha
MKQKQYAPLTVAEMAISLFAANEGYLDDVDVEKIVAFEAGLHGSFKDNDEELMKKINESGDLNDEISDGLKKAVEDFKQNGAY